MAAIQKRMPLSVGEISHAARLTGITGGRYDETRAQEAPGLPLLVRSSVAGREVRHHFAWTKYFTFWRIDSLMLKAGYPISEGGKIINSRQQYNPGRPRPTMSSYPRTANQGGLRVSPRFSKASPIKQNLYRPPTY